MLQVHGLGKSYGSHSAVSGLSLDVRSGDIFGLLGPNGAGKTTTFNCIAGLIKPTEGMVTVAGHEIGVDSLHARRSIGLVPDSSCVIGKLTASEHIDFMAAAFGMSAAQVVARRGFLLDLFGLAERADDMVETFSHGMKKKVQLASAIVHDPKLLMVDEPFAALDPEACETVQVILRRLAAQGTAIFVVTHDLDAAERTCDRVSLLSRGRELASGTVREIIGQTRTNDLTSAYLDLVGFDPERVDLSPLAEGHAA